MNIPAFDTQKAVKAFTGVGFDDKQAEAVVTTMTDVMSQNFATKADLENSIDKLRNDLEKSINNLEIRIAGKFETLYRHLWMMGIGIVLVNVTLVAAVVTLLS